MEVINYLADGTVVTDLSKITVKQELFPVVYNLLDTIEERINNNED